MARVTDPERIDPPGRKTRWPTLDRTLEGALAPWRADPGPITVLFSGGVDSGILAWELRDRCGTTLSTVGLAGSSDLASAERAARAIGLPWTGTELSTEDLVAALERGAPDFGDMPVRRRCIFLALEAAIEHAPVGELLCGQGADELFLGYAHFRGLDPSEATARSLSDLAQLREIDWPLTVRIARRLGRRAHAPFLDPGFVGAALGLPIADRLPGDRPKALWRAWAIERGVPAEIADRPKRAMQFGTGIDRWLRRLSRTATPP
ncbi:MAG: asparagine synthase-related protein [Thermoplasmata archaeon]